MATNDGEEEFSTPTGVTVMDVRHELGDGDDQDLSESDIKYHLGSAENTILDDARRGADTDDLQDAIAIEAAVCMVKANKEAFARRYDADDVGTGYDVKSWIEGLKEKRAEKRNKVTGENDPFFGTFGGRSSPRRIGRRRF